MLRTWGSYLSHTPDLLGSPRDRHADPRHQARHSHPLPRHKEPRECSISCLQSSSPGISDLQKKDPAYFQNTAATSYYTQFPAFIKLPAGGSNIWLSWASCPHELNISIFSNSSVNKWFILLFLVCSLSCRWCLNTRESSACIVLLMLDTYIYMRECDWLSQPIRHKGTLTTNQFYFRLSARQCGRGGQFGGRLEGISHWIALMSIASECWINKC